jgi:hypothetical protein
MATEMMFRSRRRVFHPFIDQEKKYSLLAATRGAACFPRIPHDQFCAIAMTVVTRAEAPLTTLLAGVQSPTLVTPNLPASRPLVPVALAT